MFDFIGNSSKQKATDAQLRQLQTRQDNARFQTLPLDMFPAKLTAYDSATGYYTWTEQWFDTSGVRLTKAGGRTGRVNGVGGATVTWMPAVAKNGVVISTFPFEVWLIRTIQSDTLGVVYEALATLPFEEMELIDQICVETETTAYGTWVSGLNIQRRTYLVAAYRTTLNGTCVATDTECCWIACEDCDADIRIPLTLTATVTFGGTAATTCADNSGEFELVYDEADSSDTSHIWEATPTFPGFPIRLVYSCLDCSFQIQVKLGTTTDCFTSGTPPITLVWRALVTSSTTHDPLVVTSATTTIYSGTGCCDDGTLQITVTE